MIKLMILSFLSVGVFASEKIAIQSKITVKTTDKEAYSLLKDLKRFPEWSPFLVTDPNQKNWVTGSNGEIGSVFHWEGVDETSAGTQTLTQLEKNSFVKFDCKMEKPFEGSPIFEYRLVNTKEGVEITQDFTLEVSWFPSVMIQFLGVKDKMRKTNELGLERLKSVLEKEKK